MNNIQLYVCPTFSFSIYLSGHWSCSLDILVANVSMNKSVRISLQDRFHFKGYRTTNGIAGSYHNFNFNSLSYFHTFSIITVQFTFLSTRHKGSNFSAFITTFMIVTILMSVTLYHFMVLICISQMMCIFSYTSQLLAYILCRNVYSNILPTFKLDYLFFCCSV